MKYEPNDNTFQGGKNQGKRDINVARHDFYRGSAPIWILNYSLNINLDVDFAERDYSDDYRIGYIVALERAVKREERRIISNDSVLADWRRESLALWISVLRQAIINTTTTTTTNQ